MKKFKELREKYLEEKTMSRAAKGHEKYVKEGMQALAKAGREGASEKKLDTIRNKYDNEQLDEISQKLATKAYAKRSGEAFDRHDYATDNDSQKDADKASAKADKTYDRIGKRFGANAQKKADKAADKEIFGEEKDLQGNQDKYNKYDEAVMDTVKSVAKKVGKALTGGSDQDQLKNLQKKMGMPQTGKKPTSK